MSLYKSRCPQQSDWSQPLSSASQRQQPFGSRNQNDTRFKSICTSNETPPPSNDYDGRR